MVELRELFRDMQAASISSSAKALEFQEVRKEIAAIKSLLLGRSQFPSPANSTGIPSWQMVEGENSNENSDESTSRRRSSKKDKSDRMDRFAGGRKGQGTEGDDEGVQGGPMRKHPSLDSNNGFNSGSSCEVVFLGKNDSSDPDHSE